MSGVGSAGDLVAATFHGRGDEDTAQPVWGQGFGPAAELPLGAELYVLPVASAILSPVTLPAASSTEIEILQYSRKCSNLIDRLQRYLVYVQFPGNLIVKFL